ncbi:hypothetical protein DPMN_072396 [Dreissena polymorpha]|uniref:Uncharacterized protein n=1 Tax=Dreissena polymorpha TaxID=45954 RepID=A0A9D3Z658_DREPO|nr:hypothetical protein DPMN_072396 [Dreissena polymorpha]
MMPASKDLKEVKCDRTRDIEVVIETAGDAIINVTELKKKDHNPTLPTRKPFN